MADDDSAQDSVCAGRARHRPRRTAATPRSVRLDAVP